MNAAGAATPFMKEDDPRLERMTLEETVFARGLIAAPARWAPSGADWLAVELQYGRGVSVAALALWFGVGTSRIYARSNGDNPARERWLRNLAEADRRQLARLVWFAGDERGALDTSAGARRLKAASEWETLAPETPLVWRASVPAGGPRGVTFDERGFGENGFRERQAGDGRVGADEREWFEGGCYGADDPHREERLVMRDRINALLAGLDDDGAAAGGSDGASDLAGEPGGMAPAGAGGDDLARVGGPGAADAGADLADVDAAGRARLGQDAGWRGMGARDGE